MDKVIIIGGKGSAICLAEQIVDAKERYGMNVEFLGYAIDDESLGKTINNYPVLCKTHEMKEKYSKYSDVKFMFGLYKPGKMEERVKLLYSYGIDEEKFYTFVHPLAYVASSAKLGTGTSVYANATIQSNVTIGKHNFIDFNVLIGHDTVLGDNNDVAATACVGSWVKIGNGAFIGLNSTVREDVSIGDFSMIGMGATVLKDIPARCVAYGNPAKVRE